VNDYKMHDDDPRQDDLEAECEDALVCERWQRECDEQASRGGPQP
jgi:hypothetical protein